MESHGVPTDPHNFLPCDLLPCGLPVLLSSRLRFRCSRFSFGTFVVHASATNRTLAFAPSPLQIARLGAACTRTNSQTFFYLWREKHARDRDCKRVSDSIPFTGHDIPRLLLHGRIHPPIRLFL